MIRFVTTNEGKFREVSALLRVRGIQIERLDRPYPEIQADRLDDVVEYAVDSLAAKVDGEFFVDDSGLFVEALGGFPGVYSSFVYRTIGAPGVLRLMDGVEFRAARFETVIGLHRQGKTQLVRGACRGVIAREAGGSGGFGFDPIFVPEGHGKTFAEMTTDEKNAVSHRGNAARALAAVLERR